LPSFQVILGRNEGWHVFFLFIFTLVLGSCLLSIHCRRTAPLLFSITSGSLFEWPLCPHSAQRSAEGAAHSELETIHLLSQQNARAI